MSPSARGNVSLLIIIVLAILSIVIVLGLSFNLINTHQLFNQQPATKQTKVYKIVGVNPNKKIYGDLEKGFSEELKKLGYSEGVNLAYTSIEITQQSSEFKKIIDGLTSSNPDLIVGYTNEISVPIYNSELSQKSQVPFLSVSPFDVRELGINNLKGSGSFVAAVTANGPELNKKRLQIVKLVLPSAKKIGIITNPKQNNYNGSIDPIKETAPALGLTIIEYKVTSQEELDKTLAGLKKGDVDILMTGAQLLLVNNLEKIYTQATTKGIPTLDFRITSQDNVLITYAHIFYEIGMQSADIADKILKGEKPGIIPVEEPKKVSFIINLKIAKKLGIPIPDSVLSQTDKVIK